MKTAIISLLLIFVLGALLGANEIVRTKKADREMARYCSGLSRVTAMSEIRRNALSAGYATRDVPATKYSPPILEIQTDRWLQSLCTIRHRDGTVLSVSYDPWYE